MKIVSAVIKPKPTHGPCTIATMFDPIPAVHATFEDGSTEKLFEYYPDETSFSETEFVGLTREQAFDLRRRKDVAYLKS
ncbi:MAG: hypothetical protein V1745_03980 [Patescibacteria group bacterium]